MSKMTIPKRNAIPGIPKRKLNLIAIDLYQARMDNWRGSLYFTMAPNPPNPPNPEQLPAVCRHVNTSFCGFKNSSSSVSLFLT